MKNLETDVVNGKFRNRCCRWKLGTFVVNRKIKNICCK